MRESTIMKVHYGTALAAVALVAVHILMRMTSGGFAESLEYEAVLSKLQVCSLCHNVGINFDFTFNPWF